jgi:hypothetical protein
LAPRRPNKPEPVRAPLPPEQIRSAIARITRRIVEVQNFDPTKVRRRWAPETKALETAIDETLAAVFGEGSEQFNRYRPATSLDRGGIESVFGGGDPAYDPRTPQYLTEGKEQSLFLLKQAVRGLEESLEEASSIGPHAHPEPIVGTSRKVFIVHGHAEGPRETVARFLERIGFEPVILHEQANGGDTIIEKFERHGDVPFAIVILTPDDVGSLQGGTPQPRARQNVVLELGYFIGRLGRHKVCALKQGELEFPSD